MDQADGTRSLLLQERAWIPLFPLRANGKVGHHPLTVRTGPNEHPFKDVIATLLLPSLPILVGYIEDPVATA